MSDFDDIRPYNDDEVRTTLLRLLNNNEFIDFENQKIAFITGSAGRSIVNKQSFFISVKNSITNVPINIHGR